MCETRARLIRNHVMMNMTAHAGPNRKQGRRVPSPLNVMYWRNVCEFMCILQHPKNFALKKNLICDVYMFQKEECISMTAKTAYN